MRKLRGAASGLTYTVDDFKNVSARAEEAPSDTAEGIRRTDPDSVMCLLLFDILDELQDIRINTDKIPPIA